MPGNRTGHPAPVGPIVWANIADFVSSVSDDLLVETMFSYIPNWQQPQVRLLKSALPLSAGDESAASVSSSMPNTSFWMFLSRLAIEQGSLTIVT